MPELYLFGGCNGAGKTTIALKVLPGDDEPCPKTSSCKIIRAFNGSLQVLVASRWRLLLAPACSATLSAQVGLLLWDSQL